MSKIYLIVPFERNAEAKTLGAKFDWDKRMWYGDKNNIHLLMQEFKLYKPVEITDENRQFGGSQLYIDMVPPSSWGENLRSYISHDDWYIIRKNVYERVNYKCECCGIYCKVVKEHDDEYDYDTFQFEQKINRFEIDKKLMNTIDPEYDNTESMNFLKVEYDRYLNELKLWNTIKMEAHERWSFDKCTNIQKLERIIALCHRCHSVTHFGLLGLRGLRNEGIKHLMKINKYTHQQLNDHVVERTSIWSELSKIKEWKLDLSIITNSGFSISNKIMNPWKCFEP